MKYKIVIADAALSDIRETMTKNQLALFVNWAHKKSHHSADTCKSTQRRVVIILRASSGGRDR